MFQVQKNSQLELQQPKWDFIKKVMKSDILGEIKSKIVTE